MLRAARTVKLRGQFLSSAAGDFKIPFNTLRRFTIEELQAEREMSLTIVGYSKNRQIFTEIQESNLADYIKISADIYYGLTPKELENEWDGRPDWFTSFLQRNAELAKRTPEATSLSTTMSFNKTNVERFFSNLEIVLRRFNFSPADIWNMDEIGITTVQIPSDHIVARRGVKQVGRVTSAERRTLLHFLTDAPAGSAGSANPSGWMKEVHFIQYIQHFIKYGKASKENPLLLLIYNHDSHLSPEALNICKDHGITVLSFPPHCSHKLQPLDRSVYEPLKKYVNTACDSWMTNHPGATMTIYDIPSIVRTALPLAITPNNITAGFQVTGIYPFNRDIFSNSEFMAAYVTDRPDREQDLQAIEQNSRQNPNYTHRSDVSITHCQTNKLILTKTRSM
ncbi:uncharacterized protein [Diabrotica undecimpunctata]|uniref:uncharacterized protein n=1 Tax=Diabrotica undecimpunctata TaxID=50387 RepID=UPI003B63B500